MTPELKKALDELHKSSVSYNEAAKKAMPIIKSLSHTLGNILWASKNNPTTVIGDEGGKTTIGHAAVRNIIYGKYFK